MFITSVCSALNKAKVRYAVVGGFAVALHGAVRGTVDLDLVLSLNEKSLVQAEKVFRGLGLVSRLPITALDVARYREEYIANRNLIAWSFYNPANLAHQLDILITEDVRKIKTKVIKLKGMSLSIASIESLIEMKKRSGRPQDLEDVRALQEIQNEKI